MGRHRLQCSLTICKRARPYALCKNFYMPLCLLWRCTEWCWEWNTKGKVKFSVPVKMFQDDALDNIVDHRQGRVVWKFYNVRSATNCSLGEAGFLLDFTSFPNRMFPIACRMNGYLTRNGPLRPKQPVWRYNKILIRCVTLNTRLFYTIIKSSVSERTYKTFLYYQLSAIRLFEARPEVNVLNGRCEFIVLTLLDNLRRAVMKLAPFLSAFARDWISSDPFQKRPTEQNILRFSHVNNFASPLLVLQMHFVLIDSHECGLSRALIASELFPIRNQ